MKNKHYTWQSLPTTVRTKSSRKLAGSKMNKPKYYVRKKGTASWNKRHCGCPNGLLVLACPLYDTFGRTHLTRRTHKGQTAIYFAMDEYR